MSYFIGVDPGLSGAAVVIDRHGNASYVDCPIGVEKKSSLNRHDATSMFRWLLPYAVKGTQAVLERVAIDQRDTTHMVSAEVLIRSHESWKTVLEVLNIPTIHLYPVQWRKPLALSGDCGETYVSEALRLYPGSRDWIYYRSRNGKWARNHNRAEALLMAHGLQTGAYDAVAA